LSIEANLFLSPLPPPFLDGQKGKVPSFCFPSSWRWMFAFSPFPFSLPGGRKPIPPSDEKHGVTSPFLFFFSSDDFLTSFSFLPISISFGRLPPPTREKRFPPPPFFPSWMTIIDFFSFPFFSPVLRFHFSFLSQIAI